MGRIRERLKRVPWTNNNEQRSDQLDYAGESIEAEIAEQDKKIEDIEKGIHNLFEMLKRRTKRIEALEERVYPKDPEEPKAPHKPDGGLEPGDVVSYIFRNWASSFDKNRKHYRKKILGQFCKMSEGKIYAYWQDLESGEIENVQQWMEKDRVTFEFRPKPEKS